VSVAMRKSRWWPIKSLPTPLQADRAFFRESWARAVTVIAPTVTSFAARGALLQSARERMDICFGVSPGRELPRGRGPVRHYPQDRRACGGKGRSRRFNTARVRRPRNFDVVAELAVATVDKSGGRISAKRSLPIARPAGYRHIAGAAAGCASSLS